MLDGSWGDAAATEVMVNGLAVLCAPPAAPNDDCWLSLCFLMVGVVDVVVVGVVVEETHLSVSPLSTNSSCPLLLFISMTSCDHRKKKQEKISPWKPIERNTTPPVTGTTLETVWHLSRDKCRGYSHVQQSMAIPASQFLKCYTYDEAIRAQIDKWNWNHKWVCLELKWTAPMTRENKKNSFY